jgi:hypothetical protein
MHATCPFHVILPDLVSLSLNVKRLLIIQVSLPPGVLSVLGPNVSLRYHFTIQNIYRCDILTHLLSHV